MSKRCHRMLGMSVTIAAVVCMPMVTFAQEGYLPGGRTLLDAHNCYPYDGEYANRIDRALATGTPVAIEQDLVWYEDPETKVYRAIVSHGKPFSGDEPSIESYFFERIRPIMEAAIASGDKTDWPLITLNVDYKSSDLVHIQDNYRVFSQYADWMTHAIRTDTPEKAEPLTVGPLLVLLGAGENQRTVFHDAIPVGGKIIAFSRHETFRSFHSLNLFDRGSRKQNDSIDQSLRRHGGSHRSCAAPNASAYDRNLATSLLAQESNCRQHILIMRREPDRV